MPKFLFPAGTTATLADLPAGTPTGISGLKALGENTKEMKLGNVQGLADVQVIEVPTGVIEPGEIEVTVFLDDTAPTTNFWTVIDTKTGSGQKVSLQVDLPGSFDATTKLIPAIQGYIKTRTTPAIEVGDDALSFKFNIRASTG